MTDWSVSRKLDEVIEQNKEIIKLLHMQVYLLNPEMDLEKLETIVSDRQRTFTGYKERKEVEDYREEQRILKERHRILKERHNENLARERAEVLNGKAAIIEKIIKDETPTAYKTGTSKKFTGCGNSTSIPWKPSYGEND